MASIIDYTQFTDLILLVTDRESQQNQIQAYIDTYEPKVLKALFGTDMYFDFVENIESEKYVTLINGYDKSFSYDGRTWKFSGIKKMLGCFVYSYIIPFTSRETTKKGIIVENAETGSNVNPNNEVVRAWNEGVELSKTLQAFIKFKSEDYPLYLGVEINYRPA